MASPTIPAGQKCSTEQIKFAILDQRPLIEEMVNKDLCEKPRYFIQKVQDISSTDSYENDAMVRNYAATTCPVEYRDISHEQDCEPLSNMRDDAMVAKGECGESCVQIASLVNDRHLKEACEGVCIVDNPATGFKITDYRDYELKLATETFCINDLTNYKRADIQRILKLQIENFRRVGNESFDYNLYQNVFVNGGAHMVARKGEVFPALSSGGFNGVPDTTLTIDKVEKYRRRIIEQLANWHPDYCDDMNFVLELEIDRDTFEQMLIAEHLVRTEKSGIIPNLGGQQRTDGEYVYEVGEKLAGRSFYLWHGIIRFIFTNDPIRGYIKQVDETASGSPIYEFIRVHKHINVAVEGGVGVKQAYNPDYEATHITCGGQFYPLVELACHIHDDSFRRRALNTAPHPDQANPHPYNFQVKFLDGGHLSDKDCINYFNDKYAYAMRHKYRFVNRFPEFSGFIAYLKQWKPSYDIEPTGEIILGKSTIQEANVTPEVLDNCDEKTCAISECMDPVTCEDTISLDPCGGEIATAFLGDASDNILRLHVCRECGTAADGTPQDASVTYCLNDNTAVYGTHYQLIDADGNQLPNTDTLSWAEGETGCKELCIEILAALDDAPGEAPSADNCCLGTADQAVDALFAVELKDATNATLGCANGTVAIKNLA